MQMYLSKRTLNPDQAIQFQIPLIIQINEFFLLTTTQTERHTLQLGRGNTLFIRLVLLVSS